MDADAEGRRRIQTETVHVCVEKGEFLSLYSLIFEVGGEHSRCCSWRTIGRREDKVSGRNESIRGRSWQLSRTMDGCDWPDGG